jgi:putative ABC transport system permease protein
MQALRADLLYAFRQLRKSPGASAITVLILALGIGANTAIFSAVDGVLLRPLPYAHPERIVHLGKRLAAPRETDKTRFSVPELGDYRQQNRAFDTLAEYHSMAFTLLGEGEPDRVQTGVVSADFFTVLGVRPALGRGFRADDEAPGAPPVLLLSHRYWSDRFGGAPRVLGRTLRMNDRPITIIGVLPPLPAYPGEDDVYLPTMACPYRSAERLIHNRGGQMLQVFGRLAPGADLKQAATEVATIAERLRREYPESYQGAAVGEIPLLAVRDEITGGFRPTLFLLLGAVVLVLSIACANVANLTLARLLRREGELVLRVALGASRGRLIRQLLTESTVLALAGGAFGILLAAGCLHLLVTFAHRFTVRATDIHLDPRVLLFALAVSLVAGIGVGLVPALQAARRDLGSSLRQRSTGATSGGGRHRARNALVVAQVAISFLLLVAAGLMVRSYRELDRVDPGFKTENVLTAGLDLPFSRYTSLPEVLSFFTALKERIAARPGVVSFAVASALPLNGAVRSPSFEIEGRPVPPGQPEPQATFYMASEDYFRTLDIPLFAGRSFTEHDRDGAPGAVVISRSLARRYFAGEDPLGKRITIPLLGTDLWTIVGVAGDVLQNGLGDGAEPAYYLPLRQVGGLGLQTRVFVRSETGSPVSGQFLRQAVHEIDPEQPVFDVVPLDQVRAETMAPSRLTTVLLSLFAALAFAITMAGVSGVIAFSVSERTQEIGIRTALGAGRAEVLGLVLRQGLTLVGIGLVCGVLGALFLVRLLSGLLFGVQPADPVTFVVASLGLLAATTAACLLPARRAVHIDPIVALRR